MDFDQLETFLEVARNLSFSRAAERRFRTQPAISAQIRAIEEEVGAKLLDRTGGKVSITAAGKIFLVTWKAHWKPVGLPCAPWPRPNACPAARSWWPPTRAAACTSCPRSSPSLNAAIRTLASPCERLETREILESIIDNSSDFGVAAMPVTDKRITAVPVHRDELVLIRSHRASPGQAQGNPGLHRSPTIPCCCPKWAAPATASTRCSKTAT